MNRIRKRFFHLDRDFGKYGVGDIIIDDGHKAIITEITPLDDRLTSIKYEFIEIPDYMKEVNTKEVVFIHEKFLIRSHC